MAFQGGLLRKQLAMMGDMASSRPASDFETAFEGQMFGAEGASDPTASAGDSNAPTASAPTANAPTASAGDASAPTASARRPWDDDERSPDTLDGLDMLASPSGSLRPSFAGYFPDYRGSDPRPPQPLAPLLICEALKRRRYYAADAEETDRPLGREELAARFPAEPPSASWECWSSAGSEADGAEGAEAEDDE